MLANYGDKLNAQTSSGLEELERQLQSIRAETGKPQAYKEEMREVLMASVESEKARLS